MYAKFIKRIMDFFIALFTLFLLLPVFLFLAVLVRIKLGSPILFRQVRPGLNEKLFTLYKFRTMIDKWDEDGFLLPDEVRLTKFGKLLRASSLDELPELINIIKGDMSIVGPRPLLVKYLPLYNEFQKRRHEVRPGLTGLAQVNGRNTISWDDKFNIDVKYVDTIKFTLDVAIIISTFIKVIKREGINSESSSTMEYFEGSQSVSDNDKK